MPDTNWALVGSNSFGLAPRFRNPKKENETTVKMPKAFTMYEFPSLRDETFK